MGRVDSGVRMVHMLTLEMNIIQQLPTLPLCMFASSCLCLLTKHAMHVHTPPSPCLAPPPININIATTLPLLLPSPINPSSSLVFPAFPPQVLLSHPISTLKTIFSSSKCSPSSTTVKFTFHILTPRHMRHLWDRSSWRDEFHFGVLFTHFHMFFCFLFGLRPFPPFCFCFAPMHVARFVCSIK